MADAKRPLLQSSFQPERWSRGTFSPSPSAMTMGCLPTVTTQCLPKASTWRVLPILCTLALPDTRPAALLHLFPASTPGPSAFLHAPPEFSRPHPKPCCALPATALLFHSGCLREDGEKTAVNLMFPGCLIKRQNCCGTRARLAGAGLPRPPFSRHFRQSCSSYAAHPHPGARWALRPKAWVPHPLEWPSAGGGPRP